MQITMPASQWGAVSASAGVTRTLRFKGSMVNTYIQELLSQMTWL